jgi:hypothetical protein
MGESVEEQRRGRGIAMTVDELGRFLDDSECRGRGRRRAPYCKLLVETSNETTRNTTRRA